MPKEAKVAVENLCPFGCDHTELDEQGYCRHLVGWTDDGKQMEVRERLPSGIGERVLPSRQPVKKGDKIVPREMSSRVYRDDPAPAKV